VVGDNSERAVGSEVVIKEGIVYCCLDVLADAGNGKVNKISQNPGELDPKQAPGGYFGSWRDVSARMSLNDWACGILARKGLSCLHKLKVRFPVLEL